MTSPATSERLPIGTTADIPLELIRRFKDQPRKHFDPKALQELADSIAAEGQVTPAWVMPVYDSKDPHIHYELIAGERRFRACKLAGKAFLVATVRNQKDSIQQYTESVMENFGRVDCSHIETARSIANMKLLRFGDAPWTEEMMQTIAKLFSHSTAWVRQYRGLNKLHPDVQAMMEADIPEKERLSFQVAITLSNLHPQVQLSIVDEIKRSNLKAYQARAFVRQRITNEDRISKSGRLRSPSRDFDILKRFLDNLGKNAEALLGMPRSRFEEMFRSRSPQELPDAIAVLTTREEQLTALRQVLQRIERNRTNGTPVYAAPKGVPSGTIVN